MNWLAAVLIFTILAFVGLPKILPNQFSLPSDTATSIVPLKIATVEPNSPAATAGLKEGDQILLVGTNEIESSGELAETTSSNKGKELQVTYLRGDSEYTVPVKLRDTVQEGQGYLGVGTSQERLTEIRATWSAPIVGVGTTVQLTYETFKALGGLVANLGEGIVSKFSTNSQVRQAGDAAIGEAANSVSGPVGILGVIFPAMQQAGLKMLLLLTAIISLSLAVMNVLPIPALDGGRWFTMTAFRLARKPLTKEREEKIQTVGFMVLLGLIVLVTIADVGKLVG